MAWASLASSAVGWRKLGKGDFPAVWEYVLSFFACRSAALDFLDLGFSDPFSSGDGEGLGNPTFSPSSLTFLADGFESLRDGDDDRLRLTRGGF